MGTNYIAPMWRMPKNANKDKLSNYSVDLGPGFNGRAFLCGTVDEEFKLNSTVSLFVLFEEDSISSSGFQNVLFSRARPGYGNPNSNFGFRLEREATGFRIKASYGAFAPGTNVTISSQNLYSYDVYHHLAITLSYTGTAYNFTIWVDGVADVPSQSPVTMPALGLPPSNTAPHNFCIGGVGNDTTIRTQETFYNGSVAQCSIFDYALDSTQISYLNEGNNPMAMSDPPKLYWPLADNMNINTVSNITYAPNISVGADSVFDFIPNDYINLGTNFQSTLSLAQNTISFWFRSDTASNYDTVFSQGKNDSIGYRFFVDGTDLSINRSEQNPANSRQSIDVAFEHQKWNHLVLVTDTSNTQYLTAYLNGNPVGSYSAGSITYSNSGTEAWIGGQYGISQYWDGQVSNFQIWSTDISSTEVTTLYNNGQPLMTGTQPQEANLKAWYKLNQTDSYWDLGGNGKWTFNNAAQPIDFVGLLDTYTGSQAAYSLRRLSNSYTGNLIRVTKKVSTVISETDIGYNSSNELDTAALAAFASGADNGEVRVVIWYDQSGNSNNVTHSTYSQLPKIYESGSLITENSKPALSVARSKLATTGTPISSQQSSIFYVTKVLSGNNSYDRIFSIGTSSSGYFAQLNAIASPQTFIGWYNGTLSLGGDLNSQRLITFYNDSTTQYLRQDGVQIDSDSKTPSSYGSKDLILFGDTNITKSFVGIYQEFIFYPSEQSSNLTGIENNIKNYHGI